MSGDRKSFLEEVRDWLVGWGKYPIMIVILLILVLLGIGPCGLLGGGGGDGDGEGPDGNFTQQETGGGTGEDPSNPGSTPSGEPRAFWVIRLDADPNDRERMAEFQATILIPGAANEVVVDALGAEDADEFIAELEEALRPLFQQYGRPTQLYLQRFQPIGGEVDRRDNLTMDQFDGLTFEGYVTRTLAARISIPESKIDFEEPSFIADERARLDD